MNKKILILLALSVIVFSMTGCADVTLIPTEILATGHTYGFWGGLWHGMTVAFAWIGQLFSNDIAMYAVNNNGGWYNFGFFIGINGLISGTLNGIANAVKGK